MISYIESGYDTNWFHLELMVNISNYYVLWTRGPLHKHILRTISP